MAVGDVYRSVVNSTIEGQPVTNIIHWQETVDGGLTPAINADGINTELIDRWRTSFLNLAAQSYQLVNIITNRIWPTHGVTITEYAGAADAGDVVEDPLSEFAAGVVRQRSDTASKSGRGRLYFSGIPQGDCDSGTFLQLKYASWGNAWVAILADIQILLLTTVTNCIWSKKLTQAFPTTQVVLNPVLGTQRRRRPRNKGPQVAE